MASVEYQVDQLIETVQELAGDNGGIVVGNRFEVSIESLHRLRPGHWLDSWIIGAAFELMDKPSCVRWGLSVPFHQTIRGQRLRIAKPFQGWKKTIESYRREAGNDTKLIYYCPLNLDENHFTLLEIDEQQETICHFNSMTDADSIGQADATTIVEEMVQECFRCP